MANPTVARAARRVRVALAHVLPNRASPAKDNHSPKQRLARANSEQERRCQKANSAENEMPSEQKKP